MSAFKNILIASCLLLTACQTTSIREKSANKPNKASIEQNKNSEASNSNYPEAQKNHLRMYVFTSLEQTGKEQTVRDGYFIDFEIKKKPDNNKAETSD